MASFPKCTLHDDFDKLLKSNQFCDVYFVVGSDENLTRIPAHTAIIVARSDWLRAKVREERSELNKRNNDASDTTDKLEVTLQYIS